MLAAKKIAFLSVSLSTELYQRFAPIVERIGNLPLPNVNDLSVLVVRFL